MSNITDAGHKNKTLGWLRLYLATFGRLYGCSYEIAIERNVMLIRIFNGMRFGGRDVTPELRRLGPPRTKPSADDVVRMEKLVRIYG